MSEIEPGPSSDLPQEPVISPRDPTQAEPAGTTPFPLVIVSGSLSERESLDAFLRALPEHPGMAIVVALDTPSNNPEALRTLFSAARLDCEIATKDTVIRVDALYAVAPNAQLTIVRGQFASAANRGGAHGPDLFAALAEDQQHRAIGVLLAGAEDREVNGAKAIREQGGVVMTQDPKTSSRPATSANMIKTLLADHVLPPAEIPAAILSYVGSVGFWQPNDDDADVDDSDQLQEVLRTLLYINGIDFRGYKEGMLRRRIQRRAALKGIVSMAEYGELVAHDANESAALVADLLISVTSFFREPSSWDVLEEEVLSTLIHGNADRTVRAWVAGCATGEEAYSLAMLMAKMVPEQRVKAAIQIIASDLDNRALQIARRGVYAPSGDTFSFDLFARYFIRTATGEYAVRQTVRDTVLFSHHNLLADPPFSRMDLICCRNLLIYLKPEVQERILSIFHFSLKPGGYLFLGKSETVAAHSDLFEPVSKTSRIYRRVGVIRKPTLAFTAVTAIRIGTPHSAVEAPANEESKHGERVRDLLLRQIDATAVLIDRDSRALYFQGPTEPFFSQPEGEVTRDLLMMVPEAYRIALRALIHTVRVEGRTSHVVIPAQVADGYRVRISASDASRGDGSETILLLFDRKMQAAMAGDVVADVTDSAIRQLESDLRTTRRDLEQSIDAVEIANTELRIANEEAMSINEELQSANEELETSKEELQSINEELGTVNAELEAKVLELAEANNDLGNLLAATAIPTIFLDRELRIKRFTPATTELLSVIASDVGRPLRDLRARISTDDAESLARLVLAGERPKDSEIRSESGEYYLRRVLPYLIDSDKVGGVVITFTPIGALRLAQQDLAESDARFRTLADQAPVLIWMSNAQGQLQFANRRFQTLFGFQLNVLLDDGWQQLIHPDDLTGYLYTIEKAASNRHGFDRDVRMRFKEGEFRWMRAVAEPRFEQGEFIGFVGSTVDIHGHKALTEQLQDAGRKKDEFLAMLGHELRNPLAPIRTSAEALRLIQAEDQRLHWIRETISRQVDHMSRLIDDLLDVARLTRGTLTLMREVVDLEAVIRRAMQSTENLLEVHRHKLRVESSSEPILVSGDIVRLTQAVENLLSNAAKFTPDGGHIELILERQGNDAVIVVRDNGTGIEQQHLSSIFELFSQEDRSVSRSSGGLGVGLALVRQIAVLHGGTVDVSSRGIGEGAEFMLRVPVVDRRIHEERSVSASVSQGSARLLVVDDNRDSADSLAMVLESYGYVVTVAYSHAEALEALTQFEPSIALLDLSAPEPDGLQLARAIKQRGDKILLLAFTGYGQAEDVKATRDEGFLAHFVKPIDPLQIHQFILERQFTSGQ